MQLWEKRQAKGQVREVGLVSCEARGQRRLYRLEPERLEELDVWVERRRRDWQRRLDSLEDYIERSRPPGEGTGGTS